MADRKEPAGYRLGGWCLCGHSLLWSHSLTGKRWPCEAPDCACSDYRPRMPAPVPGYRDAWATPPSAAFRRTDGEAG